MVLSYDVARDLLEIGAVKIKTSDYFTWTSGIKSPIYCDNRLTMSYPAVRKKITEAFCAQIEQMKEKPDIIAGCATAGIPHAAWLADHLDLPMIYIRSKPKGHGKGNQIEGELFPGQKVLVIEDLISTGGSAIEAAKAVNAAGGNVLEVLAIFTYGLEVARYNFEAAALSYRTITNYDAMIKMLALDGEINDTEKTELEKWRNKLLIKQ
jgi:orotate phosphoribosyltransferase